MAEVPPVKENFRGIQPPGGSSENEENEAIDVVIDKLKEIIKDYAGNGASIDVQSNSNTDSKSILSEVAENSTANASNNSQDDKKTNVVVDENNGGTSLVINIESENKDKPERLVVNFPNDLKEVSATASNQLVDTLKRYVASLRGQGRKDSSDGLSIPEPEKIVNSFSCNKCDYWSHNKYYLKQHVDLVHNAERIYKCPFCDYAGKRSHALKEHLVVHSNFRPYVCNHCSASFRKRGHLTSHIKMHLQPKDGDTDYLCKLCNVQFANNNMLYSHLRTQHVQDGEKIYKCKMCNYASVEQHQIALHMLIHKDANMFICSLCSFESLNEDITAEHCKSVHGMTGKEMYTQAKNTRTQPEIKVKCSECGFVTDSPEIMKTHMFETHLESLKKRGKTATSSASCSTSSTTSTIKDTQNAQLSYKQYLNPLKPSLTKSKSAPPQTKITTEIAVSQSKSTGGSKDLDVGEPYVLDSLSGWYQCTICGYSCEQQRTIKSHIWKHSGRKDLVYPMFQNGPLSVYDETPIGKPMLVSTSKGSVVQAMSEAKNNETNGATLNVDTSEDPQEIRSSAETVSQEIKIKNEKMEWHTSGKEASGRKTPPEDVESIEFDLNVSDDYEKVLEIDVPESKSETFPSREISINTENVAPEVTEEIITTAQQDDAHMFVTDEVEVTETVVSGEEQNYSEGAMDVHPENTQDNSKEMRNTHTENVVVESVNQGYPIPKFSVDSPRSSRANSPRMLEIASTSEISEDDSDVSTETSKTTPGQTDLNTLIDLLKKRQAAGDNVEITEWRPRKRGRRFGSKNVEASSGGISSSLLAVIEQVREKSLDKSEEDDSTPQPHKRRKRKSTDDDADISIEALENIEKVANGEFRCRLCHYSSPLYSAIRSHMKLHKTKLPHECSLCDFTGTSSEDLQNHMISHCKLRTYCCKICGSKFGYPSQLRAHMRAHYDKQRFSCNLCEFQTTKAFVFRSHIDGHAELDRLRDAQRDQDETDINTEPIQDKILNQLYQCNLCDFKTDNLKVLGNHQQLQHKNVINLKQDHTKYALSKCELCPFVATSINSMKSHMKRHTNDQRFVQQPLEQYKCNMCGYLCHYLPALKAHMWRHSSDSNYSFGDVNDAINRALDHDSKYAGKDGEAKKTISETAKNLITFRCCQCGFETVDKSQLNMHMVSHRDIIMATLKVNTVGNPAATSPAQTIIGNPAAAATAQTMINEAAKE